MACLECRATVDEESNVDNNEESGIIFTCIDFEAKEYVQGELSINCHVNVVDASHVDNNNGEGDWEDPDENIGGVIMFGHQNTVSVINSTVNDNSWFGIRNYQLNVDNVGGLEYPGALINVVSISEVNRNGYTGISIIRPLHLTVNDSEVLQSGNFGIYSALFAHWIETGGEDEWVGININVENATIGDPNGAGAGVCRNWGVYIIGTDIGDDPPRDINISFNDVTVTYCGDFEIETAGGIRISHLIDDLAFDEEPDGQENDIRFINTDVDHCWSDGIQLDSLVQIDCLIRECKLETNDIGLNLLSSYEDGDPPMLNCDVLGTEFIGNNTGLNADESLDLQLKVMPYINEEGDTTICVFDDQVDFGINVVADNSDPTLLLIEGVKFDEEFDGLVLDDPELVHISIEGDVEGFEDIDNPPVTIRKCYFGFCTTGISLSEGVGDPRQDAHIRNNFFINCFKGVEVLDYSRSTGTSIYNNTFIGELELQEGTQYGIFWYDYMRDYAVYNNIFTFLDVGIHLDVDRNDADVFHNCFHSNTTDVTEYCENLNAIERDPKFASTTANSVLRERLKWDSPCINTGWVDWEGDLMDSTRIAEDEYHITLPDVGCTGGGLFAGILDREDMNIADNESISDEGLPDPIEGIDGEDFDALPVDVYLMNNATIPAGQTFTIGWMEYDEDQFVGTQIYSDYLKSIFVRGQLNAQGRIPIEEEDTVYVHFDGHSGAEWYRIKTFFTSDVGSILNCCVINGAKYGLYLDQNEETITIQNSIFDGCTYYGVRGYDSGINMDNCQIVNSRKHGIYLYQCDEWDGNEGTRFVNCRISANGTRSTYSEMYMYSSFPILESCDFEDNYCSGLSLYGSWPEMDHYNEEEPEPEDGLALKIFNNGRRYSGDQANQYGSEIYLRGGSDPDIQGNDIHDVDEGDNRLGLLIYKSSTVDDEVNAEFNYWMIDVAGDVNDDDFYWYQDDEIIYDNEIDEPFTDSGEEFADYLTARRLHKASEYEEAIDYYWRHVNRYPETGKAISALAYIYQCVIFSDRDFEELRQNYLSIVEPEDQNCDYPIELSWYASGRAAWCLVKLGDLESALSEYEEMAENAPDEEKRICAELDAQHLIGVLYEEEDNIDAVIAIDNRIDELHQELDALEGKDDPNEGNSDSPLPSEFALHPVYPNPFNSTTTIKYDVSEQTMVQLSIYDSNGRRIAHLINNCHPAGSYAMHWDASNIASGTYICRMQAGGLVYHAKMLLIR